MTRPLLLATLLLACTSSPAPVGAQEQANGDLEAAFNRASSAMQAGQLAEAERGFRSILAKDPHNLPTLGNLGVLYTRMNRLSAAVDVDRQALALAPDDSGILLNLGLAYIKQKDYRNARPCFERLAALGDATPRIALLLATSMVLGDAPQQGLDLLHARNLAAQDSSALVLEAVADARLNQLAAAQAVFTRLLESGTTRAQASFLLGVALHDGHRAEQAVDSFSETLRLDPAYPGAHRERGKSYITLQRFDLAERDLRAALVRQPDDADAEYFLGALLVQTGKPAEGEPLLRRAGALLPDSWAVPFYLGKAQLAAQHPDAAIPLLQQAAGLNPDEPQVFYLLSRALRSVHRDAEAATAMSRVESLHSSALDAEKRAADRRIAGVH